MNKNVPRGGVVALAASLPMRCDRLRAIHRMLSHGLFGKRRRRWTFWRAIVRSPGRTARRSYATSQSPVNSNKQGARRTTTSAGGSPQALTGAGESQPDQQPQWAGARPYATSPRWRRNSSLDPHQPTRRTGHAGSRHSDRLQPVPQGRSAPGVIRLGRWRRFILSESTSSAEDGSRATRCCLRQSPGTARFNSLPLLIPASACGQSHETVAGALLLDDSTGS